MSGKYDFDRDLYIRKLNELREPGRPLCKHDWVGDDDCVYCRNEELENQLMTDMMKKLELDELNEKIKKLERQIDVEQMEQAKHLAEKDAEIDRLREGVKAIADHQRIIGGHMATMGSVYVMATRLIEKVKR